MEELIESGGDVDVQGLSGTISSGFHIDKLLVRDEQGRWNEMEQVEFQFNGIYDLFDNNRLLIDQISVGKGRFYMDFAATDDVEETYR